MFTHDKLFDAAKKLLEMHGFSVHGRPHYNGAPQISERVFIDFESGFLDLTLRAGELAGTDYTPVVDINVFAQPVRDLIKKTESFRIGIRLLAIGHKHVERSYILEIVLLTSTEGAAILALDLNDNLFNPEHIELMSRLPDQISDFHLVDSVSFEDSAELQTVLDAFCNLHKEPALFMVYQSYDRRWFGRTAEPRFNNQFMEMIASQFPEATVHKGTMVT